MRSPAFVFSGGNALGAYHRGVWDAAEAAALEPDWVCGASIGALTAALIAGNPPGERASALARFWDRAAAFDPLAALPSSVRAPAQYMQALSARSFGRTSLFTLRPFDVTGGDPAPGQFDAGPMRRLLAELVDLDRLNSGAMRLSALAVDLATGEEVVFDTRVGRVELDHIMASAALIPDFPPVDIGGRLLVDGGLAGNCPVHLVLDEAWRDGNRVACFASDLFPRAAPLPHGILQAAQRQSDLTFANQTAQALNARSLAWQGREAGADVFYLSYQGMEQETALKSYDFSSGALDRRRAAGLADMARAIASWRACACDQPGLNLHRFGASASAGG